MARRIIFREVKQLRSHRSLCTSNVTRKHEDYLIKSQVSDIVIPNMRFLDKLWMEAPRFNNYVALECAETKKRYTYQEVRDHIATFATSLHKKLKLKEKDVVAVMLPNCPEFSVIAFGTLQAGCILTTINPIYKEYEVTHQVKTTEPSVVITLPECYDIVANSLKNTNSKAKIVLVTNPQTALPDGVIRFSDIGETGEADYSLLDKIEPKLDDIAFIPFSSGTTGLPKGVETTYKNLLAALEIMQKKEHCFPQLTQGDFQDVVPCILPFFHIYGLIVTLIGHLSQGCKLITMPKFSANTYFDILKNDKASLLYIVPPIAILLGKHPDVTSDHFKNVRNILCGAAPLAASDIESILEKTKRAVPIGQGYGATETTCLATSTFVGRQTLDYSSCGHVMAGITLKFVDPVSGDPVPYGQPGEMYVKGPIIMKGYHKREKDTKESLTEDGFFKTGDLGYFKPDVGLFVTDRIKELIKVKGMQVAPAELESILRSHPSVQDAAVIGVPHEYFGEVPKAFIIPKKGLKTSSEEIQNFVASQVAAFKKIEEVAFVEDIPKTSSGKILRKELKKMYA